MGREGQDVAVRERYPGRIGEAHPERRWPHDDCLSNSPDPSGESRRAFRGSSTEVSTGRKKPAKESRAAELDDMPCAVGGTRASGIDIQRSISAGQFDTTPTRAVASVGNGEIIRNFLPSAATAY
jgi:hypothetical protein